MKTRLLLLAPLALTLPLLVAWSVPTRQTEGVSPKDDALVKAMCDHLSSLETFTLESESTLDEVVEDGQKIQFSHRQRALVHRPNQMNVDVRGDLRNRTYWKDGPVLTVADHDHQIWARVDVPESIDVTMDHLAEKYDMSLPLSDLFSADPYAIFSARRRTGGHVGMHEVEGHVCHHLAFMQENLDWQIWIDAGEIPVPRKLVITYKNEPGHPQYSVILRAIRGLESAPAGAFDLAPPEEYEQIEVLEHSKENENGEDGR